MKRPTLASDAVVLKFLSRNWKKHPKVWVSLVKPAPKTDREKCLGMYVTKGDIQGALGLSKGVPSAAKKVMSAFGDGFIWINLNQQSRARALTFWHEVVHWAQDRLGCIRANTRAVECQAHRLELPLFSKHGSPWGRHE